MVGQQFAQQGSLPIGEAYKRVEISRVHLHNQLPATAAGYQYAAFANGHDCFDLCLATLDHFGNCGVFCAKADAATDMDANAGVAPS